jgi:hypothetical protein
VQFLAEFRRCFGPARADEHRSGAEIEALRTNELSAAIHSKHHDALLDRHGAPQETLTSIHADVEGASMDEQHKLMVHRRGFLRVLTTGGMTAATSVALLEGCADSTSTASTESHDEERKPRYQADSPEVQTFYRVNRYPT